jgi:hypothetical protein
VMIVVAEILTLPAVLDDALKGGGHSAATGESSH